MSSSQKVLEDKRTDELTDIGNGEKPQSQVDDTEIPQQKPPWPLEDSGGGNSSNNVDKEGSGDKQRSPQTQPFSEAFNLKHLFYFENSSQNDG